MIRCILLALPIASALNVLIRHAHQQYRGSVLFREADVIDGES